jgi:hypothetical protein
MHLGINFTARKVDSIYTTRKTGGETYSLCGPTVVGRSTIPKFGLVGVESPKRLVRPEAGHPKQYHHGETTPCPRPTSGGYGSDGPMLLLMLHPPRNAVM